ncbi:MAG: hypothetical protein HFH49_13000 [Lachnospiraceae bacterium]|nr:hypothetical protein [Lachnospiraceae bacterium]
MGIYLNMQQFLSEAAFAKASLSGAKPAVILGEFENAMSVGGWTGVMRILKASEKSQEN